MDFQFYKYQGTGNDFVMIDNRTNFFPKEQTEFIAELCDRKFGIGADGLLLLENHPTEDFRMVYYNANGRESSMCGNGGRCIVHFAKYVGIIGNTTSFEATDGLHEATIRGNEVSLRMNDVSELHVTKNYVFLDTGSPHHVECVRDLPTYNVSVNGAELRYQKYGDEGANINFVEPINDTVFAVRTYERGVEDETLSCGTGVTAVALAMYEMNKTIATNVTLKTEGGILQVRFVKENEGYSRIYLTGPATQVYKGQWT